jgi:hypothetical protein
MDSAYRSKADWRARCCAARSIAATPKAGHTSRANEKESSIRARVEHIFARQQNCCGLFIHTISLVQVEAKLTLANIAYNMDRLVFHERRLAIG